ncbi:BppU family phage baseplate upper protein [Bacillus thuringiensis]|uniref:BppU family phage baseplate upper protein n=1 Tax=Bacillus thuringiensis TaxID=1428 RepID=UPI002D808345|nr:BppU family phage baseplate upper protein [Bacillus thuringiensis]MEB4894902.1 BppU family phage baseplate upper protein [Bacillus thuringiensis]MEC2564497.1 BppU family phage baseplate upper protein [Bacillus thuringiensis]MEC2645162.1 BppU family phage baseplate upper protein [Bacillus thuringiensis]MEC2727873.1 BppU family phage baseplate upper protein [Bacillus thuringiensis]MEC2752533.1 BppU family phage baseplate upper protein [Bacillus thuringiensis]
MRNEEIIIDLADPVFTKTIRSRQNDKNGLKLTVYAREKGIKLDLTGYVVKYEATNHTGVFIRDDAQIVDAKNGVFSYTFTAQAVSTSDDWTAYFVMEKNTERMSTPDIRITLRRDVKEGNIKIENYISDFEILKKTIDELQRKLNTMDVVKKSGDTMTGDLGMDPGKSVQFKSSGSTNNNYVLRGQAGQNKLVLSDITSNKFIWDYFSDTDTFTVVSNTNLLKKTGDIITGLLKFHSLGQMLMTQPDSATGPSARGLHYADKDTDGSVNRGGIGRFKGANNGDEYLYMGFGTNPWDSQSGLIVRPDGSATLKGKKIATADNDTGWINLPTTGVENVTDRILKCKRSGEHVNIIGSIRNAQNATVFATLPVGCRPVQDIAVPAIMITGGVNTNFCEVTVKKDGGIFVNGVQSGSTFHIAMNFLI